MRRDRAIRAAAVALLNGWGDPLALLASSPADWAVGVAVAQEADRIALERARVRDRVLAEQTAAYLGRILIRLLRQR